MLIQLAILGLLAAMLPLSVVWASKDANKFRKLAWVTLFLTFDLIMFGAFTRLTDSGLGCPDWPGCYGHANPVQAHSSISAAEAAMPHGPGSWIAQRPSGAPVALVSAPTLAGEVAAFEPDLVVSAGFMKLLGPAFLARFGGRTINTHPALSPSFPGIHGPADALAYGVKVTGCTLFVVDEGVDTGVIVAQSAVPVEDEDTVEVLHERIKVAERSMLVGTVGRMAREGFVIDGRRVRFGA